MNRPIDLKLDHLSSDILNIIPSKIKIMETFFDQIMTHKCKGAEWLGWFDYPNLKGLALNKEIKAYKEKIDFDYDCVVNVGIGGSYLGTRSVFEAIHGEYFLEAQAHAKTKPILFFGHHISELSSQDFVNFIQNKKPIVNVISKSGTTFETSVGFRIIYDFLKSKFGEKEAKKRIVATTDPNKGNLHAWAEENQIQQFAIPADVGGRFSLFTAVGQVPLELSGMDCRELLNGADQFFKDVKHNALKECFSYAAIRNIAFQKNLTVEVMSFFEPRLKYFAEWWKQLFGESEGKEFKGLWPASAQMTSDLHSLGQFLQQGQRTFLETFITVKNPISYLSTKNPLTLPNVQEFKDGLTPLAGQNIQSFNHAASMGTIAAHKEAPDTPLVEFLWQDLSLHTLGYAYSFFMLACTLSALALQVNPFDQPGVESYKKKMFKLLNLS